jgi:catechol 2,3-dioxygenase-like lactoylglutathione lyase family enzyme
MPQQLLRSAPYFPVADVAASARYYGKVLGFTSDYAAGNEFAIVSRDGLSIMLRRVADASKIVPNEAQGGTWEAFFWVTDAQSLHDELLANGADVVYGPIIQTAYGMKEFAVRDADGHVLGFGQDWPESGGL